MVKFLYLFSLIFLFSACGQKAVIDPKADESPTTNVNKNTVDPNINATEEVLASLKKLKETEAWKFKSVSPQSPELNVEIEFNAPNRFHITNSQTELIVIGNDTFVKEGGKWTKSALDLKEEIKELNTMISPQAIEGIKQSAKYLGEEDRESIKTKKYSYSIKDPNHIVTTTAMVWISVENGLPVRNEVIVGAKNQMVNTTTIYSYKDVAKVEKPK
jgi:hypothetical protein